MSPKINEATISTKLADCGFTAAPEGKRGGKTVPIEVDNSVINAELLFSQFIVEHNLPPSCADHAGKLFNAMGIPNMRN